VQARARNRYRSGERPIGKEVGEKVRKLIDDHIISLGIDPKIPPIAITDANFDQHVEKQGSRRARASEMEHALRYHIRKHFDEDPVRYETLSQRLEQILEELEGRWDELVAALAQVIKDLQFEVRRSDRRKTLEIIVDRGRGLVLATPKHASQKALATFVQDNRFWIYTKLARTEALHRPTAKKEFVSGEGFPYLGRIY